MNNETDELERCPSSYAIAKRACELFESEYMGQQQKALWSWAIGKATHEYESKQAHLTSEVSGMRELTKEEDEAMQRALRKSAKLVGKGKWRRTESGGNRREERASEP